MQQGRVQLDADWNEQQAINRRRVELAEPDVIGPTGAPKTFPGFEISVPPAGDDVQIGRGHFYIDGLLCENDADARVSNQPDVRRIDASPLPTADGLYVVYLEAWERHVTALEDDEIKEIALAGPDTATRTKTVWQVKMLAVTDPGGAVTCATAFPEWSQLLQRNLLDGALAGRMSARSEAEEPSPDPLCILPPGAGYRRLENQLYRVEIHTGGDRTQARFKWSRDNGTVASRIESDENDVVVNGSVVVVTEIGKDGLLTFASDPLPEWVELIDDRYELMQQRGELARVQSVDADARTVTFAPGPLPTLEAEQHPVVRRWDQRGSDATADGVAMTGAWQALEDGVEVRFDEGIYREGDYWLIPARTAVGLETGTVEWPVFDAAPMSLAPEGTRHRFARLALVRRTGGAFALVPGTDCRRLFPPLTAIEASDVGFDDAVAQLGVDDAQGALDALAQRAGSICNVLVGPGEDLAAAIGRLGDAQDALVCLRVGTYMLTTPLVIANRGHIQVTGAGPGTRIVAPNSEQALHFLSCTSVKVSNLSVEGGVAVQARAGLQGLNGALSFRSCKSVTVEGVSARCAGGPARAAACVSVHNGVPFRTQVRIRSCELDVGHLQIGVLLVHVERAVVTDNVVLAGSRPSDAELIDDPGYRGLLRRQLISATVAGDAVPAGTNATVVFNGQVLHFRTPPGLIISDRNNNDWQRAINALAPGGITSPRALERFLMRFATEMLRSRGGGAGGSGRLGTVIGQLLERDVAVVGQGIVIGGGFTTDAQIAGNSIRGALQGVHVAHAGTVAIERNAIDVSLPATATRERHGIFVGNAHSVVLTHNALRLTRAAGNDALRIEGIRLFGRLGRSVIVRHNHLRPGFPVGITFAPLTEPPNEPLPASPLWIVTENVMEQATTKIDVPQASPGHAGVDAAAVRQRMRGIDDNFA